MTSEDTPLTFPCDFPIKAMGRAGADIEATVRRLVAAHVCGELAEADVRVAESRNGRFLSVTVTVRAHSREQLDAIYRDLHAHDDVLMTL
ncbi:DUF493 domain-containing protein [Arhodomonas aquaeolei]|uniref:YbeD family protein n=1 Tax=Arhodomonas aquaeolei TaxID=2369 RepID=UPI0021687C7D|nr:DUF493 domain-containing protein [Arhodomonas aquaeolei]MCS4504099.1 DUF493 domain-containing protein [Arhodomonas aquaeolei]